MNIIQFDLKHCRTKSKNMFQLFDYNLKHFRIQKPQNLVLVKNYHKQSDQIWRKFATLVQS